MPTANPEHARNQYLPGSGRTLFALPHLKHPNNPINCRRLVPSSAPDTAVRDQGGHRELGIVLDGG
jgi:hypothetical protein